MTPIFEAQGTGGAIINITTVATFGPDPAFPTSGVTRAGLAAFTKLYADQHAPQRIRTNNVLPGFIALLPEKNSFRSRIPMGRCGRIDEIAGPVAFLASDAAGYITGQSIRVDGGIPRSVQRSVSEIEQIAEKAFAPLLAVAAAMVVIVVVVMPAGRCIALRCRTAGWFRRIDRGGGARRRRCR